MWYALHWFPDFLLGIYLKSRLFVPTRSLSSCLKLHVCHHYHFAKTNIKLTGSFNYSKIHTVHWILSFILSLTDDAIFVCLYNFVQKETRHKCRIICMYWRNSVCETYQVNKLRVIPIRFLFYNNNVKTIFLQMSNT